MTARKRNNFLVAIPVLAGMLIFICQPVPAQQDQAKPSSQPAAPVAKAIVTLKRGETRELQLCWDEGVGRAPAIFLGIEAAVSKSREAEKGIDGEPRFEKSGLVVEYDGKETSNIGTAFYRDGQFAGDQKNGPFKHFTTVVIKVTASKDAITGAHTRFIHVVSGSDRGMLLSGEFRILVRE